MDLQAIARVLDNLNRRVERLEQILPLLQVGQATGVVAQEGGRPAARAAVEPVAGRRSVAERAAQERGRVDRLDASVQTRRHVSVIVEQIRDDVRVVAEGHVAVTDNLAALRTELARLENALDARLTRLDATVFGNAARGHPRRAGY